MIAVQIAALTCAVSRLTWIEYLRGEAIGIDHGDKDFTLVHAQEIRAGEHLYHVSADMLYGRVLGKSRNDVSADRGLLGRCQATVIPIFHRHGAFPHSCSTHFSGNDRRLPSVEATESTETIKYQVGCRKT